MACNMTESQKIIQWAVSRHGGNAVDQSVLTNLPRKRNCSPHAAAFNAMQCKWHSGIEELHCKTPVIAKCSDDRYFSIIHFRFILSLNLRTLGSYIDSKISRVYAKLSWAVDTGKMRGYSSSEQEE